MVIMYYILYKFSEIISTSIFVGKINFMPGTFGSLVPIIFILIMRFDLDYLIGAKQIMLGIMLFLLVLGLITSQLYCNYNKLNDPGEVVIDEIVGQLMLIWLNLNYNQPLLDVIDKYSQDQNQALLLILIISFIVFRFFDIKKPWPISYFDKNFSGGIGIMLDDLIAGLIGYSIIYLICILM